MQRWEHRWEFGLAKARRLGRGATQRGEAQAGQFGKGARPHDAGGGGRFEKFPPYGFVAGVAGTAPPGRAQSWGAFAGVQGAAQATACLHEVGFAGLRQATPDVSDGQSRPLAADAGNLIGRGALDPQGGKAGCRPSGDSAILSPGGGRNRASTRASNEPARGCPAAPTHAPKKRRRGNFPSNLRRRTGEDAKWNKTGAGRPCRPAHPAVGAQNLRSGHGPEGRQSSTVHESRNVLPLFLAVAPLLVWLDHPDADTHEVRVSHAPL